jgi:hypothetical protein
MNISKLIKLNGDADPEKLRSAMEFIVSQPGFDSPLTPVGVAYGVVLDEMLRLMGIINVLADAVEDQRGLCSRCVGPRGGRLM